MRCIVLLCCLLPAAVYAQEKSIDLENLVVAASRSPIDRELSGSSITVISREEIEQRQSVFLSDLLRNVPGIAVNRSGSFGSTTQIRVRGSEANHILVLIDGIEINDPSLGDAVDFAHLSADGIERIEIVRGPQSALWGTDAIAGVINIVTRQADAPFSVGGFLESGSFSTQHAGLQLSGLDEGVSYSAAISYLDTDGANISRTGDEDDGYTNLTANFKTALEITDDWRLRANIRRTNADSQFDPVDFFQTGLPTDGDRETQVGQTYAQLGVDLNLPSSVHGFSIDYVDTDNENFVDGVADSQQGSQRLALRYQSNFSWRDSNLIFALEYEEDDFSQRGTASPFGNPNQDQTIRTTSYVTEYRGAPTEKLNYSLSLRYDDNSRFDSIFAYRASTSYSLFENTRLRGSIGIGQKRPTFTELFGFFPDQFIGNPLLEPEESFSWELGLQQSFGAFTAEVAYFNARLEDEINGFVFDPATFLFTAQNQDGESRREGVEASLAASLLDNLSLTASYTYTDSSQPAFGGGSQREVRRPRHLAALNINYVPVDRLNLNLNASFNGEQLDQFFPPFPQPSEFVTLDNFTLVNLTVSYTVNDQLRLVGRLENLLDEEYEEVFGFQSPGLGAYFGLQFGAR